MNEEGVMKYNDLGNSRRINKAINYATKFIAQISLIDKTRFLAAGGEKTGHSYGTAKYDATGKQENEPVGQQN
jgi:hypothetical protein